MLGVVEQEPILFNDSIGANIAYGLPIPNLKHCHLHHDHHHRCYHVKTLSVTDL